MATPEPTEASRIVARDWLDSLPVPEACKVIEKGISLALQDHDVEAVPSLLILMCRYDPRRAGTLRQAILDAAAGRITFTVDIGASDG